MDPRPAIAALLVLCCVAYLDPASITEAAKPGPLTCHKVVCPLPPDSCHVLESDKCVTGGGPPQCPAIVDAPNGTSCNDGNVCTTGDVCSAGVCGGTAVTCSSSTDTCEPASGCGTTCGEGGCVVSSSGGEGTLTIPAGALGADVRVSMVFQGSDPTDPSVFQVYSFGPTGTTFSTPATVDLPAPPLSTGQAAVIEVSDDGVTWVAISTTLNNDRVSGPIAHFSGCRTRAYTNATTQALIILDLVNSGELPRDVNGNVTPPAGEPGSCENNGICLKVMNNGGQAIIPDSTCTPTSTSATCLKLHVLPWQCYSPYSSNGNLQPTNDFPAPFDPSNPTAFEGNHCNFTGLLIPCPDSIFNFDPFLTASGLAPGDSMWVGLSIGFGVTNTVPANGVYPLSCYGSTSVGFDVLFREPSGTDWQAGIRSAKDGPCVSVPQNTVIHVPNGEGAHCGVPLCTSASGCTLTCTLASCNASWDWLANHAPNYPALRCVRNGTSINCAQFQAGDVAFKNWLIQTAE